MDLSFLGANLLKVAEGGWLPWGMGLGVFQGMEVWQRGSGCCSRTTTRRA